MSRQRLFLCTLPWILAVLSGCDLFTGQRASRSPSPEFPVAYSDRIVAGVEKLRNLCPENLPTAVLISTETCHSTLETVQAFQGSLAAYDTLLASLDTVGETCTPEMVRVDLERCASLRAELENRAVQFALLTDSAGNQFESLRLRADVLSGEVDLGPTGEFFAACGGLTGLIASVDDYLTGVHTEGLRESTERNDPVAAVFHFLGLHQLRSEDAARHDVAYQRAWNDWLQREIERGRPDVATDVFALVSELAAAHRPRSLEKLLDISAACLESPPVLEVLERTEAILSRLENLYVGDVNRAGDTVLQRVRGGLVLCRARLLEDPRQGAVVAARSLRLNPYLSDVVVEFLIIAADAAGKEEVADRQYSRALKAFRNVLRLGPVPARERRVANYRKGLLDGAIHDSRLEMSRHRFAAAMVILSRATKIGTDLDERSKLRGAFYSYYHSYVDYLLTRDVGRAVDQCREFLEFFPDDAEAKRKMDRALVVRLEKQAGAIDSSHERLGGERLHQMVREATAGTHGTDGADQCQRFVGEIRESWSRQVQSATDPVVAFRIAVELARLDGENALKARRAAAAVLWKRLAEAMADRDWPLVERCLDLCFASCPGVPRPEGFRDDHIAFLEHLDSRDDVKKLGRHLILFTRASPRQWRRVRPLIVKHMQRDDSWGQGLRALLVSLDPTCPELRDRPDGAPRVETGNADLAALIPAKDLEGTENWWQEEDGRPSDGVEGADDGSSSGGNPVSGYAHARLSITGGIVGGIVSVAFLVLLPLLSIRKKILPFPWYAAGALWIGMTIGFVLGAREKQYEIPSTVAQSVVGEND